MRKYILMLVGAGLLCSACHRAHVFVAPTHTTSVEIDVHRGYHHHHHR
jgi:hypothetical protein